MPIVRQLPKLLLRGSLANITMANLSDNQMNHVSDLSKKIANHHIMIPHKEKMVSRLRNTIGQDYKDKEAGVSEYEIAVWKATVELLYHRNYEFYCGCCMSNTYIAKRGRPSKIDREQIPCPNCKKVEIIGRGQTTLPKGRKDLLLELGITNIDELLKLTKYSIEEIQNVFHNIELSYKILNILENPLYVDHDAYQKSFMYLDDYLEPPKCKSTILYITGEKKYEEQQIQQIINDPVQIAKFYGQFVNNYFKQQIVENKRKESHRMEKITERADKILVEETIALCKKINVQHAFYVDKNPADGVFKIIISGLLSPPELTTNIIILQNFAKINAVQIEQNNEHIIIKENVKAPEITTNIPRTEHILIKDDTNDDTWSVDHVSSKGVNKIDPENHVKSIELREIMESIKNALPSGLNKRILEIYMGIGDEYIEYSKKYGDSKPKQSHLAEFFNTNIKTIKECLENIKLHFLCHGLVPQSEITGNY